MSNDLISRSELLKSFQKCYSGHLDTENSDSMMTFKSICRVINQQPASYDIDKVVEELKCDRCESCSLLEICAGSKFCGECHKKIIEIVKQGGVSDDVCEWKLEDEEANLYITECNHRQLMFDGTPKENNYKFCPYCGKEIKEVESK